MVKKKLKSKVKKPAKKLVLRKRATSEKQSIELELQALQAMKVYKSYLIKDLNTAIKNEYFTDARNTAEKLDLLSNDIIRLEYVKMARPEGTE